MALSNNDIKKIKSLSQKKFRDELGLFVVEGEKLVAEALNSDFEVVEVYRKDEIGENAMSRISQLSTPSPVLAIVKIKNPSQSMVEGLCVGLDSLRDPGNLGTIIRVCDWFGIRDIYASGDTVDVYNPKVVQATMGAIFRVRVHYCDLVQTSKDILSIGGKVYGTFLDGQNIYEKTLETGSQAPVMVVIGNEANGISSEMESIVSDKLLIPSYGGASESLNAAIATAITIAEFRRRG